jgi:hypothetical protein
VRRRSRKVPASAASRKRATRPAVVKGK